MSSRSASTPIGAGAAKVIRGRGVAVSLMLTGRPLADAGRPPRPRRRRGGAGRGRPPPGRRRVASAGAVRTGRRPRLVVCRTMESAVVPRSDRLGASRAPVAARVRRHSRPGDDDARRPRDSTPTRPCRSTPRPTPRSSRPPTGGSPRSGTRTWRAARRPRTGWSRSTGPGRSLGDPARRAEYDTERAKRIRGARLRYTGRSEADRDTSWPSAEPPPRSPARVGRQAADSAHTGRRGTGAPTAPGTGAREQRSQPHDQRRPRRSPATGRPGRSTMGGKYDPASMRTNDAEGGAGPPPGNPSGSLVTFGRYTGWSLGEIARTNLEFLEWLDRMPIGRPYRDEIDVILRQAGRRRSGRLRRERPTRPVPPPMTPFAAVGGDAAQTGDATIQVVELFVALVAAAALVALLTRRLGPAVQRRARPARAAHRRRSAPPAHLVDHARARAHRARARARVRGGVPARRRGAPPDLRRRGDPGRARRARVGRRRRPRPDGHRAAAVAGIHRRGDRLGHRPGLGHRDVPDPRRAGAAGDARRGREPVQRRHGRRHLPDRGPGRDRSGRTARRGGRVRHDGRAECRARARSSASSRRGSWPTPRIS